MGRVAALLGGARPYPGDAGGLAALGGEPDVLHLRRGMMASEVLERAQAVHHRAARGEDAGTVLRVGQLVVEGGSTREAFGFAAFGRDAPDVAAGGVVPGHIGDVAAVRRPHGSVLDIRGVGEAARAGDVGVFAGLRVLHFGQVGDPEAVERGESQPAAVRGRARPADL